MPSLRYDPTPSAPLAAQNLAAAASRIRACDTHGPTTDEMKAAWEDFKRTKLFAVLLGHLERVNSVLASEGLIWGFFYNGYMAGANRCKLVGNGGTTA